MLNLLKKVFGNKVGFVLKYTKVITFSGEQFELQTNLPKHATADDMKKTFDLMVGYPDVRAFEVGITEPAPKPAGDKKDKKNAN